MRRLALRSTCHFLTLALMIITALTSSAWAQVPTTPSAPVTGGGTPGAVLLVVGFAVALIVIIGVGVKLYDLTRKRESEALHLQSQLSDALLREPGFLGLALTPTVHAAKWRKSPPTVEISGHVPTREVHDRALDVVRAEVARLRSDVHIEDRLAIVPGAAQRAG
jgi:hypothetical protein